MRCFTQCRMRRCCARSASTARKARPPTARSCKSRSSFFPFPLGGEGAAKRGKGGISVPNLRARELRWNMTEGEQKLWALLRRKRLSGFRFRRQATIGPYIADFFCPKARLVIELDGEPHANEAQMRKDGARTQWLEAHGCRVIRFW